MFVIVLIGNVAFTLSALIVGVYLLRLARRTRQLPELLIGLSSVIGGFIGYALSVTLVMAQPQGMKLYVLLYALRLCAATASALLLVLAWRVFRPHSVRATLAVGAGLTLLATYVLRDAILGRQPFDVLMWNPLYWSHTVSLTAPYVWIMSEALHYQALLRRRARIGLPADLVVATRMQFWAVGMGAIGLSLPMVDVVRLIGVYIGAPISPALAISTLGIVSTTSQMLAFFPPKAWVRRLEMESAAMAS